MPSSTALTDDDPASLAAWLQLALTDGVSSMHGCRLLSTFGLPGQVLRADRAALRQVVPARVADAIAAPPTSVMLKRIQAALAWAAEPGHAILTLADSGYPRALLDIADPPLLMYVRGQVRHLQGNAIAVVGSRNATRQGMEHAAHFAAGLGRAGWTVVSGLALGIDAAAHRGAIAHAGLTVAVVGTGIDIDYPARNKALAAEIAQRGCIISEYPLGMPALAANFPRRNRLISGLARAVLVVEAAAQSGSLITARVAAEQGRDVFAIPGSIHSPLAKGCHQLIRQGAKLVETTQDILEEFGHLAVAVPDACVGEEMAARMSTPCQSVIEGHAALVMEAMGHDPVDLDTLALRCALNASALAAALLSLELAGHVEALPGARYRRLR